MTRQANRREGTHSGPRHYGVGDVIGVRLANHLVKAVVVEVRGDIGVGGRRLVRVRTCAEPGNELEFELPEDEIETAEVNGTSTTSDRSGSHQ